ncbi:MAG: DUF4349 domain-containing protein [Gemmatimonadota bacterium]
MKTHWRRTLVGFAVLWFAAAFSACGRAREDPGSQVQQIDAARSVVAGAPMALDAKVEERAGSQSQPGTVRDTVVPGMIIRNGSVSIEVDSLEVAMAAVRALAGRLGGYVGNVQVLSGEYQVRSATLELRIPANRFEEALSGMAPLGKVENSSTTAEDVGEEFVDVSARVANARRLEERLVALLATRTGRLEDVLAVERELARIREEIERYEGRIRFLRSRVATSTISVTVHEAAPLVSTPGSNVIGDAFRDMWRNFVGFIASLIASLGVLVPVGLIGLALFAAVRRWRRQQGQGGTG